MYTRFAEEPLAAEIVSESAGDAGGYKAYSARGRQRRYSKLKFESGGHACRGSRDGPGAIHVGGQVAVMTEADDAARCYKPATCAWTPSARGAGGQHVNKPTRVAWCTRPRIVVECKDEEPAQNREQAWRHSRAQDKQAREAAAKEASKESLVGSATLDRIAPTISGPRTDPASPTSTDRRSWTATSPRHRRSRQSTRPRSSRASRNASHAHPEGALEEAMLNDRPRRRAL